MTQILGNTLQPLQSKETGQDAVTKRTISVQQELHPQRLACLFRETMQKLNGGFSELEETRILQVIQVFMPVSSILNSLIVGQALLYWYKTVQETVGDSCFCLISNFKSFESCKHLGIQGAICLLQRIVEIGDEGDIHPLLTLFYQEELSLKQLLERLEQKKWEIEASRYPEKNSDEVLREFSGQLAFPLSQQELERIACQYTEIETLCVKFKKCTISELVDMVRIIRSKESISEQEKLILCALQDSERM